jgi:hypothetical protein
MTRKEQEEYILNFVQGWTISKQASLNWYKNEVIPALNKTAQEEVENGGFEAVKRYLKHIDKGGFS